MISSKDKSVPHRWKDKLTAVANQLVELGCLKMGPEGDLIPQKVQDALLIDHTGFANKKA